jgi:DNA-directed RNA polymerase specialized sigma24 family protein
MITMMWDREGQPVTAPDGCVAWLVEHRGADVTAVVMATGAYTPPAYDVEDVCQDAYLALLAEARRRPLATEEYLPLCKGIARHKAGDARRRRARCRLTNVAAALPERGAQ